MYSINVFKNIWFHLWNNRFYVRTFPTIATKLTIFNYVSLEIIRPSSETFFNVIDSFQNIYIYNNINNVKYSKIKKYHWHRLITYKLIFETNRRNFKPYIKHNHGKRNLKIDEFRKFIHNKGWLWNIRNVESE